MSKGVLGQSHAGGEEASIADKDKIRIIVAGRAGVGRSTVIQFIQKALVQAGLDVRVNVNEFGPDIVFDELQLERISIIRETSKIEIEERYTYINFEGGEDHIFGVKG